MKRFLYFLPALMISACGGAETSLIWIEHPSDPSSGLFTHEILVCNPPSNLEWDMWSQIYYRGMAVELPGSEVGLEWYEGHEYVMTPKVVKDTLRLLYTVPNTMNWGHYPHGFVLRDGKRISNPEIIWRPLEDVPVPDQTYRKVALRAADIIPQPKNVEYLDGCTELCEPDVRFVEGRRPSWYRLTVDGTILIEASDPDGVRYAKNTLSQIVAGGSVGNIVVEDWPDFQYRIQHVDCARCFYPVDDLKKIIDLMERCKMNYLHLHLSDDEGWRLEIDGLPELTEFGAFHYLPEKMEDGSYKQVRGLSPGGSDGKVRKNEFVGTNGYYTREDFKEILTYAAKRGITVFPEFDYPAHSHACVAAMEHRYETTGDDTYLLTDPSDTSSYVGVQKYRHNVMNVALPSTYAFVEKVIDETMRMYDEAGLKMELVHIGGDEVPDGAWMGSPEVRKLMAEKGLGTKSDLMEYFLSRYADILLEKGIGMTGWASMTSHFNDEGLEKVRRASPFMESPAPQNVGYERALQPVVATSRGIRVVVGSADYYYMDNAYSTARNEHGMVWCGPTDERKVFSYRPYEINYVPKADEIEKNGPDFVYEAKFGNPENIVGVVSCLWGDIIFNSEMGMERFLPKGIGAFERCWNASPEGEKASFDKFYSIVVEKIIPFLDDLGLKYRKPMDAE